MTYGNGGQYGRPRGRGRGRGGCGRFAGILVGLGILFGVYQYITGVGGLYNFVNGVGNESSQDSGESDHLLEGATSKIEQMIDNFMGTPPEESEDPFDNPNPDGNSKPAAPKPMVEDPVQDKGMDEAPAVKLNKKGFSPQPIYFDPERRIADFSTPDEIAPETENKE